MKAVSLYLKIVIKKLLGFATLQVVATLSLIDEVIYALPMVIPPKTKTFFTS